MSDPLETFCIDVACFRPQRGLSWHAVIVMPLDCHFQVRKQLVGTTEPNYSEYTCYTGISDFTPPDIDTVGYRVFLGNGKYFVSSDVGGGKMQWYGFHKEPAGAARIWLISAALVCQQAPVADEWS